MILIPTYVESQKQFSESVLDGANLFCFSQFSCEELKTFAPSEAVLGFLDGVTTRSYVFFREKLENTII